MSTADWMSLIWLIGVLIVIGPAALWAFRDRRNLLPNLLFWLALFFLLVILYNRFSPQP